MPFSTRQFSLVLKIDKVIQMHEKQFYRHQRSDIRIIIWFSTTKKHFSTQALINLIESIMQTLHEVRFGRGLFVDFQKAFDTVDHKILRHKLKYCGIQSLCNVQIM